MINLLPTKEKKNIQKGFYFRSIIVILIMLGLTSVIATIAILPSYFFSITQKSTAVANLEKQKTEEIPVIDAKTESIITELNNKMALIENAEKSKFLVSEKVISEIILRKMTDIKISKISYEDDLVKGRNIYIYGKAPNRERLLLFRQALENDVNFKNVNLPISNFIKGKDIIFSLSLSPA